jgi:dihydrofolate reductase
VPSKTLHEPLPWPNSTLLGDDGADAVAQLKAAPGTDLHVMGSGDLFQTLLPYELIDGYLLLIHPLVLDGGRRLFVDGGPRTKLRLVQSRPTSTGVPVATYATVA